MFPHRNIHKHSWISSDGKTHNQIDHMLIDRGWHSSIFNVRYFRGADSDTYHYLMIAKFRESLTVSKQASQKFDVEIFNLRKLNELEVRKRYWNEISKRFAAVENLSDSEDINMAWKTLKRIYKPQLKTV